MNVYDIIFSIFVIYYSTPKKTKWSYTFLEILSQSDLS